MRFELEKEDALGNACSSTNRYITTTKVRVNSETTLSLPTTSYVIINDFRGQRLIVTDHSLETQKVLDDLSQGLQLKLEKVGSDYKLALITNSGNPYYYYYNENRNGIISYNIATIDHIPRNYTNGTHVYAYSPERCSTGYELLESSKFLIDPKDIISSKNMSLIGNRLDIRIGDNFFKGSKNQLYQSYRSIEIHNSAGSKVGMLNNVVPIFDWRSDDFKLFPFHEIKRLNVKNSYFATEKLGSNYVGCISDENSTCKNFYDLNPDSFGYEHDSSPSPYPYYYNLENFGNFLEIDVKHREYIDLEDRIKKLERAGVQGPPGQKGEDADPSEVAARIFSEKEKTEELGKVIFETPVKALKGKTLEQYFKEDLATENNLRDIVAEALKKDKQFKQVIRGDKGLPGPNGVAGPKGDIGPQGPDGKGGAEGLPGSKGEKGDIGPKGADGVTPSIDKVADEVVKNDTFIQKVLLKRMIDEGDLTYTRKTLADKVKEKLKQDLQFTNDIKGKPGPAGPRGEKGEQGQDGKEGTPGPKGDQGPRGFNGTQGLQGKKGEQGSTGEKGNKGNTGAPGTDGLKGTTGEKGDKGNTGPKGADGVTPSIDKVADEVVKNDTFIQKVLLKRMIDEGDLTYTRKTLADKVKEKLKQDLQFTNDIKGKPGPAGPRGEKGEQGQDGKEGTPGPKGDQGPRGFNGTQGLQGKKGEQGSTGEKGNKGDKGNVGAPGTSGEKGDLGPVGPKGIPGPQGFNGTQGEKGDVGLPGMPGLKGDIGPIGPQGLVGSKGDTGTQGEKGDVGLPGIDGLKGDQGIQGLPGEKGLQGIKGDKGMDANPEEVAQKLINNGTIANEILEYRNQDGDLVLEQQVAGRLIYDQNIHAGIATELIDNKVQELADALLGGVNDTLVEKLANSTELTKSISEELRKNPGKVQGLKGDQGDTGASGMPGPKGDKGDVGDKGDTGVQGMSGLKGETGTQGEKGAQGDKGEIGAPGTVGLPGMPGIKGDTGEQGPQGFNGTQGEKGDVGLKGEVGALGTAGLKGETGTQGEKGDVGLKGDRGEIGAPGIPGPQGFNGTQGEKGAQGDKGEIGAPGTDGLKGEAGPKGDTGVQGLNGQKGDVGPQGLKGDQGDMGAKGNTGLPGMLGLKGEKGNVGLPGVLGPQGPRGDQGFKGQIGRSGPQGPVGPKGDTGPVGPKGDKGEDGVGATLADQFLREIRKAKNETLDAKKAAEDAKSASEIFAKEAEGFKEEADNFADKAFQSEKNTQALHSQIKDIFCKTKPTDQVCTVRRKKREIEKLNNPPVTSGASRPTSFISQVINFFYPSVKQDEYKIENKIQELNQVAKIIDAADIVMRFEKVLEETASKCGIPKKSLNFDPVKLQSTILDRSLFNDESRNELLKLLYLSAKKSCPNYKQTDRFLATFKDRMERTLENNEQQRGFVNIEKTATDNEQPRSFMSDVTPPSNFSAINREVVGYLR